MMNRLLQQRQHRALFILLFALFLVFACNSQPRYAAPAKIGADVAVDETSLQFEIPRFFTYRYDGKNISFFVIRMKSGIQSYLDACTNCYPHKMGYHFANGAVECRFCGQNFSVSKLQKGLGGCYPIAIGGRVEKGQYLISVEILEKAANKF